MTQVFGEILRVTAVIFKVRMPVRISIVMSVTIVVNYSFFVTSRYSTLTYLKNGFNCHTVLICCSQTTVLLISFSSPDK